MALLLRQGKVTKKRVSCFHVPTRWRVNSIIRFKTVEQITFAFVFINWSCLGRIHMNIGRKLWQVLKKILISWWIVFGDGFEKMKEKSVVCCMRCGRDSNFLWRGWCFRFCFRSCRRCSFLNRPVKSNSKYG